MTERKPGEPRVPKEPKEHKEPTPEQATFAKIDFFLSMRRTLLKVVDQHVPTLKIWSDMTQKQQKKLKFLYLDGLLDEYIIHRYGEKSDQVAALNQNRFDSDERETFQALLKKDRLLERLESREESYDRDASNYTSLDILSITKEAVFDLRTASSEQREILFEEAGYTAEQRIAPKLGVSAKDMAIISGVSLATEPVVATLGGLLSPDDLGNISDPKTLIGVAASYALHYGTAIYNAIKNHQLLKDQNINTCPNLWSTVLYLLLQKYRPRLAQIAVYAGTILPTLAQEVVYGPLLLVPGGAAAVIARNLIGTSIFGGVGAFLNTDIGRRHLRGGR